MSKESNKNKYHNLATDVGKGMAEFGLDSLSKSLMTFFVANPIIAVILAVIFSVTAIWMMGVAVEQFLSLYAWLASIFVVAVMFKTKTITNRAILVSSLVISIMFWSFGFISFTTSLPSIPILGTLIKGLYSVASILVMPIAVIPLFVVQATQIYLLSFIATVYSKSNSKNRKQ